MGVVADLLVAGHAPHHVHLAVLGAAVAGANAVEALEHLELGVVDGVGVVVDVGAGDIGLAAFPVQALDLEGHRLDHVDGAFVQGERRGGIVHLGDDLLAAIGAVDHHEVAVGHRAQRHRVGRVAVGYPVPAFAFRMQHAGFGQHVEPGRGVERPVGFAAQEGQLEGGAAQVVEQDQRLVGRDARVFGIGGFEETGMPYQVLVQRVRGRHQHAQRRLLAPARAAHALPGGRHRTGVAVEHHDVERADVHAQLQRRGADDAIDVAGAHRAFGLAAFVGQVAAAVGADARRLARVVVEDILQVFGKHLDHRARLREHQGLEAGADRQAGDAVGLRTRRGTQAQVGVHHRRIPQQQVLFARRRARFGDGLDGRFHQRFGMLLRVANRRRAQDELRVGTVERTHALEPTNHVGQVRAEHAAVGVHFVDDHVAQVFEELRPLGVMRKDGLVQHVGVGHHQVGVQADGLAGVAGRVAVEGVAAQAQVAGAVEFQQVGHLVLRQRLGREQEQRLGLLLHRRRDHRQRVTQAFARGRGRDHHEIPAGAGRVPGLGLVAVELADAARAQRRGQRRRQVAGQRRIAAFARGLDEVAGDPVGVLGLQPAGQLPRVAHAWRQRRVFRFPGRFTGGKGKVAGVVAGEGVGGHGRFDAARGVH